MTGMGRLLELGRRVHLLSMDAHCHDITIGLYEAPGATGRAEYLLHSYSSHPDAGPRLAFLARAMVALGGMAAVPGRPRAVCWPCGDTHLAATRRLFTEVCKLAQDDDLAPRRPELAEPKLGTTIRVRGLGGGRYRVTADAGTGEIETRLRGTAGGFARLAEMVQEGTEVRFPCGSDHDALMALLIFRANNVRAAMRAEEMAAARGVLLAPSAQAQTP
jgi:hypothetical protein